MLWLICGSLTVGGDDGLDLLGHSQVRRVRHAYQHKTQSEKRSDKTQCTWRRDGS